MKCIKVGAASLNQTPLDWSGNSRRILEAIETGRKEGVSILCLPEMSITGYSCDDLFLAPHVSRRAFEILRDRIAPATRDMVVAVGLPLSYQNSIFNAVALVANGSIVGFVVKQYLAGDGIHYEPRYFKSWPNGVVATLVQDDNAYVVGDIHFMLDGVRIGFEICEDAWVAKRPGANLAFQGVDIILNPSASHFARRKFGVRARFVEEGSRAFGVTYVYANLVGNESGPTIYDGGCLIAYDGSLIAAEPRFSYKETNLITAVVDVAYSRVSRNQTTSYKPLVDGIDSDCVHFPFKFPEIEPSPYQPPEYLAWELSKDLIYEEFCRAAALGLFDYLRKSRAQGFTLSLSGGADSACVAVLVRLMVKFGIRQLGYEEFAARLSHIKPLKEIAALPKGRPPKMMAVLLSTLYQSTDNSSDVTRQAAAKVAQAVGSTHAEINIQGLVDQYTSLIETASNHQMSWETDDVTLQNIQARTRAPSAWMLANLRNQILLATSNRSEAAVGYATMDGDTAGGLSPIAGVDKPFVRNFLRWLETTGVDITRAKKRDAFSPTQNEAFDHDDGYFEDEHEAENYADPGFFKIPALSYVNEQQPTAELRPSSTNQTDEGDLMPYAVLDTIEKLLVRKKLAPSEILTWLKVEYPEASQEQLLSWLDRFVKLFTRNQWKRTRYAPGFHLDTYSLDARSWFRFPILSAGFAEEMADLKGKKDAQ